MVANSPRSHSKEKKPAAAKSGKRAAPKAKTRVREPRTAHKVEREEGPLGWLLPNRKSSYAKLIPRALAEAEEAAAASKPPAKTSGRKGSRKLEFHSTFRPGRGEDVLAALPRDFWVKHMQEFQRRKAASPRRGRGARGGGATGSPVVPGTNNWIPLGPSVQARGSAVGRPAVSGRTPGIAIAPGGSPMYVATAAGGVWRSDDNGASWKSTMDGFDLNTNAFAATCLACGAIALDPADPNRVYVGTGEGDTDSIFSFRLVNALPCYKGVGPIRSDDGGATGTPSRALRRSPGIPSIKSRSIPPIVTIASRRPRTASTSASRPATAINGSSAERACIRASSSLHRSASPNGSPRRGATRSTPPRAGRPGPRSGPVFRPASRASRLAYSRTIRMCSMPLPPLPRTHPCRASCRACKGSTEQRRLAQHFGHSPIVQRWPSRLRSRDRGRPEQRQPDLPWRRLLDDPSNAYPGSIYCCVINSSGSSLSMTTTLIGTTAHADDHVLVFTPGNSNALWLGSDGGLFLNTNPSGGGSFVPMNTGLATLCTSHFTQHPTEPGVMFVGLQDNGTAKYVGEEVWNEVEMSDGGYGIVNWNNPFKVMCYWDGSLYVASDGGIDFSSWTFSTSGGATMEAPVVSAPYNPGSPGDANIVAFGVYGAVQISSDFGASWPVTVAFPSGTEQPYSMVGASAARFFVGTAAGKVYRLDKTGGTWGLTEIDNAAGGPLPLSGLVSDIAVDWSDSTLSSIYICFGGSGDYRHVWHFNGTAWQAASGTASSSTALLDIEHNAIQYDRPTGNLYVGADLGLWKSTDGGAIWNPMANGLPDAAVFDLQLHPTQRLLRACLHGRGLWEWKTDAPVQADVELLIRDTLLDTGTDVNNDGRPDPSVPPGSTVVHYESPNIRVDVPTPLGYQNSDHRHRFSDLRRSDRRRQPRCGNHQPAGDRPQPRLRRSPQPRPGRRCKRSGRCAASQRVGGTAAAAKQLYRQRRRRNADRDRRLDDPGFCRPVRSPCGVAADCVFRSPLDRSATSRESSRPVALLSGDDFALAAGPLREY